MGNVKIEQISILDSSKEIKEVFLKGSIEDKLSSREGIIHLRNRGQQLNDMIIGRQNHANEFIKNVTDLAGIESSLMNVRGKYGQDLMCELNLNCGEAYVANLLLEDVLAYGIIMKGELRAEKDLFIKRPWACNCNKNLRDFFKKVDETEFYDIEEIAVFGSEPHIMDKGKYDLWNMKESGMIFFSTKVPNTPVVIQNKERFVLYEDKNRGKYFVLRVPRFKEEIEFSFVKDEYYLLDRILRFGEIETGELYISGNVSENKGYQPKDSYLELIKGSEEMVFEVPTETGIMLAADSRNDVYGCY